MKFNSLAVVAIAGAVLANPSPSEAQGVSGTPESRLQSSGGEGLAESSDTYGSSDTSYVVGAYDFAPQSSASTFSGQIYGDRFFTSAGGIFVAPAYLPNGAVITRMEIQGCDTNAGADLFVTLFSSTTIGGSQSSTNHGSASASGTPGCGFFSTTFAPAVTVSNQTRTYYMNLTTGATDNTVRFSTVRLFYHLQVSPGPLNATFPLDVPTTHAFYRFIEALAASGVTGGCGTGVYCPDAAVTRGQMAVFLATALGLHFQN